MRDKGPSPAMADQSEGSASGDAAPANPAPTSEVGDSPDLATSTVSTNGLSSTTYESQNGHLSPVPAEGNGVGNGSASPGDAATTMGQNFVPQAGQFPSSLTRPGSGQRSTSPIHFSSGSRGSTPPSHSQQHVVHVHVNPGETFSVRVGDQIQHIQATTTIELVPTDPTGWQQQYSHPEPCHLVVPPLPSMRPPESLDYVNGASPPVPPLHKGGMPWLPPELRQMPPHKMMCSIFIDPPNYEPRPQGPATVRMVSNSGPPLPMPMQVPPGHMVQQIVDENGILTHVILSPQPQGMVAPPMTVLMDGHDGALEAGPNGSGGQMYSPYGAHYATYPPGHYATHHHPHHSHSHAHSGPGAPPPPPHMAQPPGVAPPQHLNGTPPPAGQPPHSCSSHGHPHSNPYSHPHPHQGPPPVHHNHTHLDDRTQRQKQRLRDKLQQRIKDGSSSYAYHAPTSPRRGKGKMNGSVEARRVDAHSSSSSGDGQEIEEERRCIQDMLSKITLPKVSEVEPRSALIHLTPPDCSNPDFVIEPTEFRYELLLSDKGREGKYKSVYNGDATEITLKDLKPATEYHLRVSSILDDLKGDPTEAVTFRTQCCEPDPPPVPKLSNKAKTWLSLKWTAAVDNGSRITSYSLESNQGHGDLNFVEVYSGNQRQHKVTKLTASTCYAFRLAASNAIGKSEYSDVVHLYTSGIVPTLPDPPMLSDQFVKALTISWIQRPNDDTFTLQMEDAATGHGFLTVYNGPELSHKIKNLRRNTEYKYRLCANNEEGSSKFSDVCCYRTLPDRPAQPPRPALKGKVHATKFRVTWDPPKDDGGSEIQQYYLELDAGHHFEHIYDGLEREHLCDQLLPGHLYRVRVSCSSEGGQSEWSDSLTVTMMAMVPGPCQAPKLQGKPKATTLHLRWNYPDYDGGAAVTEFEVQMAMSDNSTREVYRGQELDCVVTGLQPGRSYIFQVRACNKAGTGEWSESLEVVSGAGVPDPPKMPQAHGKSPHSAAIMWEEPVNNGATITEYRLEWQPRGEGEFMQLYFGSATNYEVRGLTPAMLYNFRVQALNSAGVGPFSSTAKLITPPSSPSSVVNLRATATAETIVLTWKAPVCNGSEVLSYNIDLGEKHQIFVGSVLDYVIQDLLPETTYKIRVQAVNGIGVGPFSSTVKVTTRPLPPEPPRLECISCTHNSLKLKWGDGRNPDLIQYVLEMMRENGSFHPIYHGPSHSHKVNKLAEKTTCEFRIHASNDAGDGPYSEVHKFTTTIAPPPACKSPKVSQLSRDSVQIEWPSCRQLGQDSLTYCLQLQRVSGSDTDSEYKQVYRGSLTSFHLTGLASSSEYQVRVCAIRICSDHSPDLMGAFSPGTTFCTPSPKPVSTNTASNVVSVRLSERKPLTEQQWAILLLVGFAVCAVFMAFLAQHLIGYTANTAATK